jgi:hypothetical protein
VCSFVALLNQAQASMQRRTMSSNVVQNYCSMETKQIKVKVDEYRLSDESSGIKVSKLSFTSKGRGSLYEMTSANTGALTVMSVGSRKFRGPFLKS